MKTVRFILTCPLWMLVFLVACAPAPTATLAPTATATPTNTPTPLPTAAVLSDDPFREFDVTWGDGAIDGSKLVSRQNVLKMVSRDVGGHVGGIVAELERRGERKIRLHISAPAPDNELKESRVDAIIGGGSVFVITDTEKGRGLVEITGLNNYNSAENFLKVTSRDKFGNPNGFELKSHTIKYDDMGNSFNPLLSVTVNESGKMRFVDVVLVPGSTAAKQEKGTFFFYNDKRERVAFFGPASGEILRVDKVEDEDRLLAFAISARLNTVVTKNQRGGTSWFVLENTGMVKIDPKALKTGDQLTPKGTVLRIIEGKEIEMYWNSQTGKFVDIDGKPISTPDPREKKNVPKVERAVVFGTEETVNLAISPKESEIGYNEVRAWVTSLRWGEKEYSGPDRYVDYYGNEDARQLIKACGAKNGEVRMNAHPEQGSYGTKFTDLRIVESGRTTVFERLIDGAPVRLTISEDLPVVVSLRNCSNGAEQSVVSLVKPDGSFVRWGDLGELSPGTIVTITLSAIGVDRLRSDPALKSYFIGGSAQSVVIYPPRGER